MKDVVIVDSVRTGLAKAFRGSFNLTRSDDMPRGSLGRGLPGVAVLDPETGEARPPARFGPDGLMYVVGDADPSPFNTDGTVWRLDPATGAVQDQIDLARDVLGLSDTWLEAHA